MGAGNFDQSSVAVAFFGCYDSRQSLRHISRILLQIRSGATHSCLFALAQLTLIRLIVQFRSIGGRMFGLGAGRTSHG